MLDDVTGRGAQPISDALRESEERYRTLVDGSGGIVQSIDPEGRFLFVSPHWLETFGYSEDEVSGLTLWDLIHPDSAEHCQDVFTQLMGGVSPVPIDACFVTKASALVYVEGIATARREAGEVVATHALLHDVSAQKAAEEDHARVRAQLAQAQKMEAIGRLAGGVAHDFNNMLCVISGNAERVLGELTPRDPLRVPVGEIVAASQRSAELTHQLLAFSRKQVIEARVLDLNELIGRMRSMLRRVIGEDLVLRAVEAPELWHVRTDPGQVEQIVLNLTVNARDAMRDGGELRIETRNVTLDDAYCEAHVGATPGQYAVLAVSDTGCGMEAEVRERIFEPFFTTKPAGEGTGLGLATVFGIVEQSGGRIEVETEPGGGTTFEIYLPRVDAEVDSQPPRPVQRPHGGDETILVVEDEEMVLRLAKTSLERQGYSVLAASSPGDALAMAHEHEGAIDLLFTDVIMPRMNGRNLAATLAEQRPAMRILYASGHTQDVVAQHGVSGGGIGFLAKPYTPDTLSARVRELLDTAHLQP